MTFSQIESRILKETWKEVYIAKSNDGVFIIYRWQVISHKFLNDFSIDQFDIKMMDTVMKWIDKTEKVLDIYYFITELPYKIKCKIRYWYYVTRKQWSTKA